ncbi:unnamed protein product [Linum tenue]|uniref:HAUS augmin-like complex subunit 4 n=1 Tax=Linum tenue TaxID=586396 RepID=A0AAV0H3F7_9ROSI|nr:unnamed protein product [Linum tenue]
MHDNYRVLEHVLLLETYTQESIPALHKIRFVVLTSLILQDRCMKRQRFHLIKNVKTPCSCFRKYLIEATEEASLAYNKAATRLHEYLGVDPQFDTIARQYQEIVRKLENLQWTIHEVEKDVKQSK